MSVVLYFFRFLSCCAHLLRLRRHYPVKLGVFRETDYKGQHRVPVEDKPLARFGVGEGLIFYGNVVLPFVDRFPKDTELYRVMTTKPEEVGEA